MLEFWDAVYIFACVHYIDNYHLGVPTVDATRNALCWYGECGCKNQQQLIVAFASSGRLQMQLRSDSLSGLSSSMKERT